MKQKRAEDIALELGFKLDKYYTAAQQMMQQGKFGIAQAGAKNV